VKKQFQREFTKICNEQSTVARLKDTVYDRYRYKGAEIERKARRALRTLSAMHTQLESLRNGKDIVVTEQGGQGESALLLALMYPEVTIHYKSDTAEAVEILEGCMANFVTNIKITNDITEPDAAMNTLNIVIQ
jgi:hypothetical protein